jgi:hypothetical protein
MDSQILCVSLFISAVALLPNSRSITLVNVSCQRFANDISDHGKVTWYGGMGKWPCQLVVVILIVQKGRHCMTSGYMQSKAIVSLIKDEVDSNTFNLSFEKVSLDGACLSYYAMGLYNKVLAYFWWYGLGCGNWFISTLVIQGLHCYQDKTNFGIQMQCQLHQDVHPEPPPSDIGCTSHSVIWSGHLYHSEDILYWLKVSNKQIVY